MSEGVNVEFVNLDEITRKLDDDLIDEPLEGAFQRLGEATVGILGQTVRDTTELHTGRLAGEWDYNPVEQQVETPVPYARFVDAGTKYIVRPRRFVAKAIKRARTDADQALAQAAREIESKWGQGG